MNREQRIAHLMLHGYLPYADTHGWVAIWSEERGEGRMCKYFDEGVDGPGWDVRPIISSLALTGKNEVPWHRIDNDQLGVLAAPTLPPRFRHRAGSIVWDD